ncbi:hypothetical protein GCM10027040_28520 [Halomonas shantousis]
MTIPSAGVGIGAIGAWCYDGAAPFRFAIKVLGIVRFFAARRDPDERSALVGKSLKAALRLASPLTITSYPDYKETPHGI